MGAGAVLHSTAKSKLTELGGLIKMQPMIFALYMIGAFSISGFPLFNGFISKSMVIKAADDGGLTWAYLLLIVASVGTFLHTGLKLPYFTWLGPQRNITPKAVPINMRIAMGIAAFLCFFMGIRPGTLYRFLPFVTDFHPYTAAHLMESVQILVFTGIAFYFFIVKLGGEATISLDTDWFYRWPKRVLNVVLVQGVSALFSRVDQDARRAASWISAFAKNPPENILRLSQFKSMTLTEFNPDQQRPPLGLSLALILIVFIVLVAFV
jgi:multicomponent Na+:H+ antiporter subunit D